VAAVCDEISVFRMSSRLLSTFEAAGWLTNNLSKFSFERTNIFLPTFAVWLELFNHLPVRCNNRRIIYEQKHCYDSQLKRLLLRRG